MSQEFFSNETVCHFAQSFPQTFQKLVEEKSFTFKHIESIKRGFSLLSLFNDKAHIFQVTHFLMLKLETFSLNVVKDRLVCSNHAAGMQGATAEQCAG